MYGKKKCSRVDCDNYAVYSIEVHILNHAELDRIEVDCCEEHFDAAAAEIPKATRHMADATQGERDDLHQEAVREMRAQAGGGDFARYL